MKGSLKSLKNVIVVMALGLLTINATAQDANNFDEIIVDGAFIASLNNTVTNDFATTETGALIISDYQEGAAIIKLEGKFGLINKQGYEICQPIYDDIHLYNKGYAAVQKNGKWTFVNKQGQRLTPLRYDWVGSFTNGLAAVRNNGKWGMLNEQGFEIVPTAYQAVKVDRDGNIWVQSNDTWKPFGSTDNIDGQMVGQ